MEVSVPSIDTLYIQHYEYYYQSIVVSTFYERV